MNLKEFTEAVDQTAGEMEKNELKCADAKYWVGRIDRTVRILGFMDYAADL